MADDEDDDLLNERIQAFIDHMHGFTQSLVRMNPATKRPVLLDDPKGGALIGSGVVVLHNGRKLLLSAKHVFEAGAWALETKVIFKKQRECLLFSVGPTSVAPNADFGWVELDEDAIRRDFLADPRTKGKTLELPYYQGPLDTLPKKGEAYGYAASNNVTLVTRLDNPDLWREGSYEIGMEYDGRADDGRFRFKLGRTHKGDPYYGGSSGAPIADPEGRIVSLVSGGDGAGGDVIFGTPLADVVGLLSSASPGGNMSDVSARIRALLDDGEWAGGGWIQVSALPPRVDGATKAEIAAALDALEAEGAIERTEREGQGEMVRKASS